MGGGGGEAGGEGGGGGGGKDFRAPESRKEFQREKGA